MKTIMILASCAALLIACASATADVTVSVAAPFSNPPFLITPG